MGDSGGIFSSGILFFGKSRGYKDHFQAPYMLVRRQLIPGAQEIQKEERDRFRMQVCFIVWVFLFPRFNSYYCCRGSSCCQVKIAVDFLHYLRMKRLFR
jgi:hypothetical protein